MTVVSHAYRPKRARKRKAPVELTGPRIVKRGSLDEAPSSETKPQTGPVIVTARKPRGRFGDAPDLTPEELQRRRNAADALFHEVVRRATASKDQR
jgi:hypothetical protein